ncbi:hypothetical protein B484DRAFT_461409, partial [Ochromonadaceae sp. CCMP2298]
EGILIGPGRYSRRNSRDEGGYIVGIRDGNRASGGVQCAIYLDCGADYAQGHCVASYANSPHRVVHAEHRTPAMANARLVVASSMGNGRYRVTLVAGSPSQVEALSHQTRPVVIYGGTSEILYSYSDSYRYPLHVGHDHGVSPGPAGQEEHAYGDEDEDDYDDDASEGQQEYVAPQDTTEDTPPCNTRANNRTQGYSSSAPDASISPTIITGIQLALTQHLASGSREPFDVQAVLASLSPAMPPTPGVAAPAVPAGPRVHDTFPGHSPCEVRPARIRIQVNLLRARATEELVLAQQWALSARELEIRARGGQGAAEMSRRHAEARDIAANYIVAGQAQR